MRYVHVWSNRVCFAVPAVYLSLLQRDWYDGLYVCPDFDLLSRLPHTFIVTRRA